ncbi:MAG: S8 family serine peptidase [Thermoleophilia bacterium]
MARIRLIARLTATAVALGAACTAAVAAAPTDPQAAAQQPLQIMRVPLALDLAGRPLQDVPVMVADTGLDLDNPDIAGRLFSLPSAVPAPDPDGVGNLPMVPAGAHGWDLIGNAPPNTAFQPDPDPSDVGGHGTMVAGVLGAQWNNGQGGAGVAPNARFIAMRTCWVDDNCYQYAQASAIDWAADRGARVVSFSWLSGSGADLEAGLRNAITGHPNVLFVTIPSGNGGAFDADPTDPMPCNLDAPNVLCVTTSAPDDGLDVGAFGRTSVDVAVPTANSVTTSADGGFVPTGSATSFASPTAAGVATILLGIDPTATAAEVRSAIIDSARKVPAWQGKSVSGGIVDAAAAVALFQQRRGIPTPQVPGGPGPGSGPQPADRTAPSVSARRSGASVFITLSEPARVRLQVQRASVGRRVGRACRSVTRVNRRRAACTRWVGLGARSVSLGAGRNRIAVPKRDPKGRLLRRATLHRLVIVATDAAGNAAPARSVTFRSAR